MRTFFTALMWKFPKLLSSKAPWKTDLTELLFEKVLSTENIQQEISGVAEFVTNIIRHSIISRLYVIIHSHFYRFLWIIFHIAMGVLLEGFGVGFRRVFIDKFAQKEKNVDYKVFKKIPCHITSFGILQLSILLPKIRIYSVLFLARWLAKLFCDLSAS